MYIGPEGFQLGNFNDGRFIHAYSNGDLYMPGFRHVDGQLTLDRPILISPQTQTGLSASLASLNQRRNNTFNYETFSLTAIPSGATGNVRYLYSLVVKEGDILMVSEPDASTLQFRARGNNVSVRASVTVMVIDDTNVPVYRSSQINLTYGAV